MEMLFGEKVDQSAFLNSKKRPDITVLKQSSIGVQGVEAPDENGIEKTRSVLLIEVKRGGFPIGREEIYQADGYVQDIAYSEFLGSRPYVSAFVVGDKILPKTAPNKNICDADDQSMLLGKVTAITFAELITTAEKRLFKLREKLDHYANIEDDELLNSVFSTLSIQPNLIEDKPAKTATTSENVTTREIPSAV